MKHVLRIGPAASIATIDARRDVDTDNYKPRLQLVTDSQDVQAIREHLDGDTPRASLYKFASFFTAQEDGEYTDIYGCEEYAPSSTATVYKITSKLI